MFRYDLSNFRCDLTWFKLACVQLDLYLCNILHLKGEKHKVDARTAELKNITDWATINNLSLNLSKSEEIVFIDKRRKSHYQTPETLNGLKRIQHIKILGVTFTSGLSVSLHVQQLIASNA